ncbi:POLE2 [Branchiostoma lanceolatum]|uniref:DNA polymerase epsilon subunit n=1 Tax=Branchiostoma lanceolatum TaxID=7740 RepID=A0A8J9ZRI1_BRALA|nr:POLE2 [Branchiostoma lanceolatum]
MAGRLKSSIMSAFKMHGLSLRIEASKFLVEALDPVNEVEREEWLDRIIEAVQKQPLESSMIDRVTLEAAVQDCVQGGEEDSDQVFSVIDAFDIPKFDYNSERKKFIPSTALRSLHGQATDKAQLFRDRYTVLFQRTSRHELFTPAVMGANPEHQTKKFQLRPVEYLLGSVAKLGEIIVLGMVTQLKPGSYYLEDPTGAVKMDLRWYEDQVFHVTAFGFPPPEPAKTTRAYFGNINFFGGPSATCAKASTKLRVMERENEDAMIVFLSDVWLDDSKVMEKLRVLFTGYSEICPTAFVLCGNFTSSPFGSSHIKTLKESFRGLGNLIAQFPSLVESSRFIFVPGSQDPGPGNVLPRPAIPDCVTEELRRKVPNATFTTNPCRIQYCTQEIVVFREDMVTKMCRNCVKFPTDRDISTHFVKTLASQGHLCPLPLHVEPVYWGHDHTLRVYPLPDVVVVADKFDAYSNTHVDCTFANPGSFACNDAVFKVYYPATRQMEDSQIRD